MVIKYVEQKSNNIKTVSIKHIYEWMSIFLKSIKDAFKKGTDELSKYFKEEVSKTLKECEKEYKEYISSVKDLPNASKRKKFCEYLETVNEKISKLSYAFITSRKIIRMIIDEHKIEGLDNLDSTLEKIIRDKFKEEKRCKNFINLYHHDKHDGYIECFKRYNNNGESQAMLKKDLEKIKKESKVKSYVSNVLTVKNKAKELKKLQEKNNRDTLVSYSEKVVPVLKEELGKFENKLKENNLNPKNMKHINAIEHMIEYWGKHYSPEKIKQSNKSYDTNYCRKIGFKLANIAQANDIKQSNELIAIFTRVLLSLPLTLNEYEKEKDKDAWRQGFEHEFAVNDTKKLLTEDFINKIPELKGEFSNFAKEINARLNSEVLEIAAKFGAICPSH